MAFNISQFKTALEKHGGLSRNNTFEVVFNSNNAAKWSDPSFTNSDLKFFCKTVSMPGISLLVFDYRPTNIEMSQSMPIGMNHEQLECLFMVDDKHNVFNYFHRWMQRVINYNTDGHEPDSFLPTNSADTAGNLYPYELGYKKDYIQQMSIIKYSRNPNETGNSSDMTCTLNGVYPTSIGTSTFSWDENDTFTVLPVSFSYSSIQMSGATQNTTGAI